MAKKSARKEITKINLKQAALEGLSCERACETAKRAGKPSYRFTVGDKVQVGHLLNCVVDEALEGGYMYLIRSGANSDNYSCWAWTNVRPLDDDKDTHFAKRNSALSRLHYSNRSMYSLLSFQYLFGVDFNPDYQRGSVWDDEGREKLLDSIFMGREIGRFVFKQLPFTRTSNDGNYYEIVDGKQRMLTLLLILLFPFWTVTFWISTTTRISTVLSASPFPMAVSIMLTPSLGTCTAPMTSP